MAIRFLTRISAITPLAMWGASLTIAMATAVVDYVTGPNLSLSPLYLIPVLLTGATRRSRSVGLMAATATSLWAAVRLTAPFTAGESPAPLIMTAALRFVVFWIAGAVTVALSDMIHTERLVSRSDHLTGLLNRRGFVESAHREVERMRRTPRPLTAVYVDLDDLKVVNDRDGHHAGDLLLAEVGMVLAREVRTTDSVGRVGGDEFAVLLPDTAADGAAAVVERLRGALTLLSPRDQKVPTVSIGVVTFPNPPSDVDMLLREADEVMYAAKRAGKDDVRYAEAASTS